MYAVGKVLYTVAAPFHPFGGAVDIVVVQQQDGSFKSSPWYVRFGKFQGVLKAKEKVVKIAVNGVEAGFNMYLDSNGEAHFLRDADPNIAEGNFVVSASSSGDELVVPTQDTQLRKSNSISCDISTMEASAGDGKVLARQSTILERMFGRKSIKDSAHAVDRVGSLERAEIAAELLDTNWSTSRGSEARSSNHEPSSSHHTDADKANQAETTKMVFPDCSFDHYKAVGSNCDNVDSTVGNAHGGRRSSGDEKEHCTQTTSVKEEVVAICTHKTGDFTEGIISTIDQAGSESLPNDMDTGKSTKDPIDTQGELQGNFEDGTIREMHVEEVLSHGIFEIRAIETNITNGRSEVVAQFVAVGSDGVSQNFTQKNSPTYSTTYFSSERHNGSLIDCGHDACQEKVVSISSPEIVESSYDVSSILADKVRDAKGISLTDGLQSEECSRVSSEKLEELDIKERSLSYHGDCSNKEGNLDNTTVFPDKLGIETSLISDSSSLSEAEAKNTKLEDNANRLSSASGVEIGPVPEEPRDEAESVVSLPKLVENTTVLPDKLGIETSPIISDSSYLSEADAENAKLEDNVNRLSSASGVEIGPVPDDPRDRAETVVSVSRLVEKTTVWPNKLEVETSPIISDSASDSSSLSKADAENTKLEDNANRLSSASGVEIGPVPEEPRDEAESVVSLSKLVENTTVLPDKLGIETSPIISDSSYLSEADAENTKLEDNVNRPSSACGVEIRPVPDDPRDRAETVVSVSRLVEKTTVWPNKLEVEISPIMSDSSCLSEADADNTKLEDNVNRPSSACGVEIGPVSDDPRDEAESVVSLSKLVENTTVLPDKLGIETSPIISDSSNLSEGEEENTKLEDNVNRPSYACGVEIRPVPDDPRDRAETVVSVSKLVEKTTVCSNKLETEISPIVSELSSLSKVEAKHTKLEDNVNRPGSASGVEVWPVPDDPRDKSEAIVSSCEFLDEIQFQFSDTRSFADGKTLDDVVANKASGGVVHDEADGNADEEEGDDVDIEIKPENRSDFSRPETSIIPIPGSELHLSDNNLEAKSLPNLRSHIQDLERSDSFQASCSLYNSESSVVDPVKSKVCSFPEQELEGTGESKQDICASELINNPVPDDKKPDDLKVDSFSPFVELSLCRHLLSEGMGADAACRAFDAEKITLEKFRAMKQSLISDNKLVVRIAGRYFPWDVASPVVLGMVSFSEEQVFEHQGMIKVERVEPSATQVSSWRIWPFSFRRTSTMNAIQPVCETVSESTVENTLSNPVKDLGGERNIPRAKRIENTVSVVQRVERKVQSLTPTSEELASLDLREGRNVVTFTFSTAMLGIQQVDANIYLWKWNTHIVISDVDGTITKSDVLGQFMPMVGVDWSQNGVAHLFSAIKENGYQLLFLSARSISQAHLTRQFLFNLKQDGKALPDGPVVISPDGLFPSLYREVIRRAPHEFKISCLGTIKALFPPDSHPFYAGFGNRDTDELSYLKVGIPMGKIFIINPKGEVAVNRRVNTTKSYMSLHALVNRMFPPMSSPPEQEDFNTWNYWKMPLPDI
uniref:Uncharacterized protein n=1 Tax=Avena sativa TaxID=4498 RepID=A0ACD5W8V4_AVESA